LFITRRCAGVLVERESFDISCFRYPVNPGQTTDGPDSLMVELALNVVLPIAFLSAGGFAGNEPSEDVSGRVPVLNHSCWRRKRNFVVCVGSRNPEVDFQGSRPAIVSKTLKLISRNCRDVRRDQPICNQMLAIPNVLVADEAEEVIENSATGGGDVDLIGCHKRRLAERHENRSIWNQEKKNCLHICEDLDCAGGIAGCPDVKIGVPNVARALPLSIPEPLPVGFPAYSSLLVMICNTPVP